MSKPVDFEENPAGGFDLMTERDGGNPVRILTGAVPFSLDFWRELRNAANVVIPVMEERQRNGDYER